MPKLVLEITKIHSARRTKTSDIDFLIDGVLGDAEMEMAYHTYPSKFRSADMTCEAWLAENEPEPYEPTEQEVRAERDKKLAESDWRMVPDYPFADQHLWTEYRQQLRDITAQEGFPASVSWPQPPET